MIIVEYRLDEVFNTLPVIINKGKEFKPVYNFGTHEDLLVFLIDKQRQNKTPYPLIWFETEKPGTGYDEIEMNVKLILAVQSLPNISNKDRVLHYIKPILEPVYENVLKALRLSGITSILNEENIVTTLYYNYTDAKLTEAISVWDAIKVELTITVNEKEFLNCINYG
jgi:hypothetical protein